MCDVKLMIRLFLKLCVVLKLYLHAAFYIIEQNVYEIISYFNDTSNGKSA